jgi:TonB family protein
MGDARIAGFSMRATLLRMSSICIRLSIGTVWILTALPALAQTDARGLEDALKGKQLVLRSYSADKIAHYDWADGKLVDAPASVHTLGVFDATSAKLKGQKLSISGSRATLIRDAKTNKLGLASKSQVEIEINLNGADAASVLPQLRTLLFFPDLAQAIAGLPERVAKFVPASVPRDVSPDPCHCQQLLRDGEWVKVPLSDSKLSPPTLIHAEDPNYTSDAMGAKVGPVRVRMLIDTEGNPTDLWLTVSQGYGLDESVEAAVQKYRFNPARYDNKPEAVELEIEVNYQIH